MSDDAKWAIGILLPLVLGLIGWGFKTTYDMKAMKQEHAADCVSIKAQRDADWAAIQHSLGTLKQTTGMTAEMVVALKEWKISRWGRNGDHQDKSERT